MEENKEVTYKFTYKDEHGKMGWFILPAKEDEEAIAKFERRNPDLVWRGFEIVKDSEPTIPLSEAFKMMKWIDSNYWVHMEYDNLWYNGDENPCRSDSELYQLFKQKH